MVTLEGDHVDPVLFTPTTPGELRYEIANAGPGDTVRMAPGIDPMLGSFQIFIDKNLIVGGQGANATTISVPASNHRIFRIGSMTPAAVVTISDVTMTGGHARDGLAGTGEAGEGGGAILTNAELTLDRVAFVDNRAGDGGSGADGANGNPGDPGDTGGPGGFGGAVYNLVGGELTVTNSTFASNSAGDGGTGGQGGDTTVMFGFAGDGGTGGVGHDGGAISNAGALTVTNSTFFDNESGHGGTGGDVGNGFGQGGEGGDGGDGGAIHQSGAGSVTLTNTTIASNVASSGGLGGMGLVGPAASGAGGTGGGTFIFNTVTPTIANTLYALNTAASGSNCAGGGPVTSQGANLSFPSGGCPASFSNGDPVLGGLADNGGPTQTMALGPGSAAIDQVPVGAPNCPGADQRGTSRPQGSACDIGAFEVVAPPAPPPGGGGGEAGDTTPPDTQITAGPKAKTKKKSASFSFTSTEPGSTFECKLDDGAFEPCTSPRDVKVKKGKHTFSVRAKDSAGNVDPTPATQSWKVKKKKKK